jgi:hypothetical protein
MSSTRAAPADEEEIRALLVDPVASSTVYAATFGGGVFVRPAD